MSQKKTARPALALYRHNVGLMRWLETSNSLLFLIPVWVSFELRYISLAELALIEGAIALTQLILELPTGALADLIGRKKTIAIGYFLNALGYFSFTLARNFPGFLLAGAFFGFGEALISGAKEALVFDTLKESKKTHTFPQLMNSLQIRFYWGMAISTLLGGLLFQLSPYLPSLCTAIACVSSAFLATRLWEPSIDSEKFTLQKYISQTKEGFGELFRSERAKKISSYYILLAALTWPMVISFKNITMQHVGLSELEIGLILPIINLLNVHLFQLALHRKLFVDLKIILPLLALVVAGSWLTLATAFNTVTVVVIVLLLSFLSSCRWQVIGRLTNLCYASKNRATAISTLSMAISLSYTLIMLSFSLVSRYSSAALTWIFLLLFAVAAFVLLPLALHLRKKIKSQSIDFELQTEPVLEKSLERQGP